MADVFARVPRSLLGDTVAVSGDLFASFAVAVIGGTLGRFRVDCNCRMRGPSGAPAHPALRLTPTGTGMSRESPDLPPDAFLP